MFRAWKKRSMEDKIVDIIIYIVCAFILFITIYPFYYILIVSFNEGIDASLGGIYWLPRKFTLENYTDFFSDIKWLKGLMVSALRTVLGTG